MTAEPFEAARCGSCHGTFHPIRPRCPRCGGAEVARVALPSAGRVLASTALEVPPPGWTAPHPLVLVELDEGLRVLGVAEGAPPVRGTAVRVRADGAVVRVEPVDAG